MTRRVLIKNENGAFVGVADVNDERIAEGTFPVSDNDLVDGKPVADWPVGVHAIRKVEFATADTPEDSHGEA
jgi:hypothetical protein